MSGRGWVRWTPMCLSRRGAHPDRKGATMIRRLFAGALAAGLLLIGAPAYAQPPDNHDDAPEEPVEMFALTPVELPTAGMVDRSTPLLRRATLSCTRLSSPTVACTRRSRRPGDSVAVPLDDPSLPSFTGKFTQWSGFNQNAKAVSGTFTFNIRGTGSDGSTFRAPTNRSLQRTTGWHRQRVLPLPRLRLVKGQPRRVVGIGWAAPQSRSRSMRAL